MKNLNDYAAQLAMLAEMARIADAEPDYSGLPRGSAPRSPEEARRLREFHEGLVRSYAAAAAFRTAFELLASIIAETPEETIPDPFGETDVSRAIAAALATEHGIEDMPPPPQIQPILEGINFSAPPSG